MEKKKQKHIYPEFDHFYPKTEHPILALSFYNLIPSCNICNSHYKQDKEPIGLLHPYCGIVDNNHFTFKCVPQNATSLYGFGNQFSIGIESNASTEIKKQTKKSIEFFGIIDNYEKCHNSIIQEIMYKAQAFNNEYLKQLEKTHKMSFNDSYKIIFESYFEDELLHKRPFSKLKKDIFNSVVKKNKISK